MGSSARRCWGHSEVETPPHPGAAGHPNQALKDMVVWRHELGPPAHGWWAALTNSVPGTPRMAPARNGRSGSSSSRHGRTTGCLSTRRHSWLSCGESRLATRRTRAPSWSTAGTWPPRLHSRLPSAPCPPFSPGPRVPPDGPLHLHSAGVGRTGCFIVIDAMLERIKPEKTVDVYGHVTLMRSQRNYMVQTEDQYSFIHEALLEAVGCGNTEVPARSLYAYIQKLTQVEPGEHVTGMELEFKVGGEERVEDAVLGWGRGG